MVVLHVKKGDESQFLFETTVKTPVGEIISRLVKIYNGRLKIQRICSGGDYTVYSSVFVLVRHAFVIVSLCIYSSTWLSA